MIPHDEQNSKQNCSAALWWLSFKLQLSLSEIESTDPTHLMQSVGLTDFESWWHFNLILWQYQSVHEVVKMNLVLHFVIVEEMNNILFKAMSCCLSIVLPYWQAKHLAMPAIAGFISCVTSFVLSPAIFCISSEWLDGPIKDPWITSRTVLNESMLGSCVMECAGFPLFVGCTSLNTQ